MRLRVADSHHLVRALAVSGVALQTWLRSDESFEQSRSMGPLYDLVASRYWWAVIFTMFAAIKVTAALTTGRVGLAAGLGGLAITTWLGVFWTIGNPDAPQGPLMLSFALGTFMRLGRWWR